MDDLGFGWFLLPLGLQMNASRRGVCLWNERREFGAAIQAIQTRAADQRMRGPSQKKAVRLL